MIARSNVILMSSNFSVRYCNFNFDRLIAIYWHFHIDLKLTPVLITYNTAIYMDTYMDVLYNAKFSRSTMFSQI